VAMKARSDANGVHLMHSICNTEDMIPAYIFSQSSGTAYSRACLEADDFGFWEGVWEGLPRSTVIEERYTTTAPPMLQVMPRVDLTKSSKELLASAQKPCFQPLAMNQIGFRKGGLSRSDMLAEQFEISGPCVQPLVMISTATNVPEVEEDLDL